MNGRVVPPPASPHFVVSALSAAAYGGYTYFRNILPFLADVDPTVRFTVLVKPRHLAELSIERANMRFLPVPAAGGSAAVRMLWEQAVLPGLLERWGADAVYTANNVGLLRGRVPVVIAIRNLEPFFHGGFADGPKARARNHALMWLTRRSVERAARTVVVSEYTKDVVSQRFGCGAGRMRVIYHGRPNVAADLEGAQRFREQAGLAGDYLMTNSKFVPYSNLHNVVEGYARAVRRDASVPRLLLAGGDASPSYKEKVLAAIRSNGLEGRIVLPGLVPYPVNLGLMRSARLFVFGTTLEACPNTLIEAMAMGVPVACSDRPPMPEIAGDAVSYFDPLDPDAIASRLLEGLAMDGAGVDRMREAGRERATRFDWRETARRLVATLREAATG